jgi:hypothetical protein
MVFNGWIDPRRGLLRGLLGYVHGRSRDPLDADKPLRARAAVHCSGACVIDRHAAAEWQAAMGALILVAESGGPTMLARVGVMRALNQHVERVFNPDRKDTHWGMRKLARDR